MKNRKASRLKRFEAFRFTAFPYPRGKGKAILLKPSEFFTKKIFAPPTLAFFPFLNRLRISADFFMCSQRLNVRRTLGVFSGKSVFINFQILPKRLILFVLVSHRKLFASLRAAARQDFSSAFRGHSCAETKFSVAFNSTGLICPFHGILLFYREIFPKDFCLSADGFSKN